MAERDLASLHGGALPADAIDVWHLDLSTETDHWQYLDAAERARAERLRIPAKRVQFVSARGQLRQILASYRDQSPQDLAFAYGEHGKPSLLAADAPAFNLSHSRLCGMLVVSATADLQLGVDIEFAKPERRFAGIAERFFATAEYQHLLQLPAEQRATAFYRIWTCKEAYLKAWGTGLSFASSRFTIAITDRQGAALQDSEMPGEGGREWQFVAIATPPDYSAAVCYPGPRRWLRHFCTTAGSLS